MGIHEKEYALLIEESKEMLYRSEYWDSAKHLYNTSESYADLNETDCIVSFNVLYPEDGILVLKREQAPMIKLTDPIIAPLKP